MDPQTHEYTRTYVTGVSFGPGGIGEFSFPFNDEVPNPGIPTPEMQIVIAAYENFAGAPYNDAWYRQMACRNPSDDPKQVNSLGFQAFFAYSQTKSGGNWVNVEKVSIESLLITEGQPAAVWVHPDNYHGAGLTIHS